MKIQKIESYKFYCEKCYKSVISELKDGILECSDCGLIYDLDELDELDIIDKLPIPKPVMLDKKSIDFNQIIEQGQIIIDEMWDEDYSNDHDNQYIYEIVMETLFGSNVFDLINSKID